MKVNIRVLVVGLALLVLVGLGHNSLALTLDEKSLASTGFSGITLGNANQSTCKIISFPPFESYTEPGNDTLLSFTWDLIPYSEADANVIVQNATTGERIAVIYPQDRGENNHVHVLIPAHQQDAVSTRIQLCVNTSATTENSTLSSEGMVGLYQEPRFDGTNNFQTLIAGDHPQLGQEIPIQVHLTNTGSQPADVTIDYRKYDLDYIPLLKGETGFQGIIQPGEKKIITYLIKPLRSVSILLPPAVLTYTNIFGEHVVQESTRAFLNVKAPEFNVKGAFLVPQTQANVNEPLTVRWVAKNEGITPITDLVATFTVQPRGTISPVRMSVATLSPSAAESREFTLTFDTPGKYELGCSLTTKGDPSLTTNCQSATLDVVENSGYLTLLFSLVLLIIAIAVYAYIAYGPTKSNKPEPPKRRKFQTD